MKNEHWAFGLTFTVQWNKTRMKYTEKRNTILVSNKFADNMCITHSVLHMHLANAAKI